MGVASLRRGRGLALAILCLLSSTAVRAQWSVSAAIDSDYRFRGVSLSESGPTLQLALNYDAPNRCYGGASARRVELARGDPYALLLGYAGCVVPAEAGRQVELGATLSHFTGDSSYDFAEVYVGLLAAPWVARLHLAPDYFGRHVSTAYAELDSYLSLNEHFRLSAHLGAISRIAGRHDNGESRMRFDLRLGAGWVLRELELQVAWVAASRGGPYPAVYGRRRAAWVAGASYAF